MKKIKTARYIKKEALWSLPGDSDLPPGVTDREISERGEGIEEDSVSNQQGESEVKVNWKEFNQWFASGSRSILPSELSSRSTPSYILIDYTYSYNYTIDEASDIMAIQIKDYATRKIITDTYLLGAFVEYYEDQIKNDIKISEEDNKIERSKDYNPFEG